MKYFRMMGLALAAAFCAGQANAQELTGTLKNVKETGAATRKERDITAHALQVRAGSVPIPGKGSTFSRVCRTGVGGEGQWPRDLQPTDPAGVRLDRRRRRSWYRLARHRLFADLRTSTDEG